MIIEILIAIILGCLAGIITGITPGIHINLVSVLLLSASPILLNYTSPLILAVFILSMAIMHTFTDAIPSIFLGAPEADTVLNVLPGHKMLMQGQGYEAVKLTVIGSLLGLILIILLIPLLLFTVNPLYSSIQNYIAYILIIASLILIIKDKNKWFFSLIIFLLAGTFGIIVLNMNLKQPLLPLLSGLFGASSLILSLKDKIKIPKQIFSSPSLDKKETTKVMGGSLIASILTGFLPGFSASQSAILASSITGKLKSNSYLLMVGAINTIVMIISFVALYTIDKARNGAIIAISKFIDPFTMNDLITFIAITLIVGGIATFVTLFVTKHFSKLIERLDYSKVAIFILTFITILVTMISGWLGLLIFIISTAIGILPALRGINRSHLMGCLILPVILFFLL
ncbi:MAG TPA: tripartite tricarboxylate transporter permease [Candidatus Nanoarchaeia archaeon]|nr:tripartite tricarboxylate transporter permease [Candidatus Nanoarchaeia archaeon]